MAIALTSSGLTGLTHPSNTSSQTNDGTVTWAPGTPSVMGITYGNLTVTRKKSSGNPHANLVLPSSGTYVPLTSSGQLSGGASYGSNRSGGVGISITVGSAIRVS